MALLKEDFIMCLVPSRGVGCIFIEMIQGVAAFPGMKDIQDQLERIFLVSRLVVVITAVSRDADFQTVLRHYQCHIKFLNFKIASLS